MILRVFEVVYNSPKIVALSIAIFVFIILSGFFSSSEMVYATVNQLRLKKRGKKYKVAKIAYKLAEDFDATLTTILFSNNLVNIAATSLATILATEIFLVDPVAQWGALITSASLLILLLIFGEILPKVIGKAFSYRLSLLFALPIRLFQIIFFPFVWISTKVGTLLSYPFRKNIGPREETISNDELNEMIDTIEEEGVIDEDQGEFVRSAVTFKDTEAHEIMTPRIDIFSFDMSDGVDELLNSEFIYKYSRIPIYVDRLDNLQGTLPTKTLLRKLLKGEKVGKKEIKEMLIEPQFVPFSMGISEILENMKKTKNHVAYVIDEFGGISGMLTMEDILEELVGDIFDETDVVKEDVKKIKRNLYEIDGSMNIDDFFNLVDVERPENVDFTSVGGWVIDVLERFPKLGDKITYKNLTLEVIDAKEFTVEKVLVKVKRKRSK